MMEKTKSAPALASPAATGAMRAHADLPRANANEILRRAEEMKSVRSVWESHWQEIGDYILPRRADFSTYRSPGEKRRNLVFDGTALQANENLAAALHVMLTSPSTPWFQLRFRDAELNRADAARRWLETVVEEMLAAFNAPWANWNSQAHELYLDIGALGTGLIYVGDGETEGSDGGVVFQTRHLAECYIAENSAGRVDTLYRRFRLTARQAAQKWEPELLSDKLREATRRTPDREFEFLHCVEPRPVRDRLDARASSGAGKPFRSVYVETAVKHVIAEGGFDEFPYMAPRWRKLSGETYGRSPGMTALADVKMVNEMMKTVIRGAQKAVDPPLAVPNDGFMLPLRTAPGSVMYFEPGAEQVRPVISGARPELGLEIINAVRDSIRQSFHNAMFQFADRPNMSATEALIQDEDRMRNMSPMVGRLQSELLGPLIARVFAILNRQGRMPERPEELIGAPVDPYYVSPVAKAQRAVEARAIERIAGFASGYAQVDPSVLQLFDGEAAMRRFAEVTGVPADVLKPREQVADHSAQQAQVGQLGAMMDMIGKGAGAVDAAGQAMRSVGDGAAAGPAIAQGLQAALQGAGMGDPGGGATGGVATDGAGSAPAGGGPLAGFRPNAAPASTPNAAAGALAASNGGAA